MNLSDAIRLFSTKTTARTLGSLVGVLVVVRLAVGNWQWKDLAIVVGVLAAEPFTEWLLHTRVLHFRPREWRGRRIDPLLAREHRAHHADPRDLDLVLIPQAALRFALAVGLIAPWLIAQEAGPALTGSLAGLGMLLTYEWVHFLIHSNYKPRSATYRRIWRAHRWHHFRNEQYWFGVTVHLADRLFGTYPDKDAVPLSPTARTLGVDS